MSTGGFAELLHVCKEGYALANDHVLTSWESLSSHVGLTSRHCTGSEIYVRAVKTASLGVCRVPQQTLGALWFKVSDQEISVR